MSNLPPILPVILSGGSGTRLWPLSTDDRPKQFLNLTGPVSMFQKTLERCEDREVFSSPTIIGSARHTDLISEQLAESGVKAGSIILEPCARNTAPAIALAAFTCKDPQTIMLVMPSDHVITKVDAFLKAIKNSQPLAQARWLMTFGIEPTGPETGYGYIEQGDAIVGSESSFAAKQFVEKPNHDNASKMLEAGGYHWNAGIFLFRADSYLTALKEHSQEIYNSVRQAVDEGHQSNVKFNPNADRFSESPSDSIDYAVMEKADKVAVTPVNPGWSDVGSWDSLFDIGKDNIRANVTSGEVLAIESKNNLIHAGEMSISTYGVDDLIIIVNDGQIMVLPRGKSQNVKKIVEQQNDRK